MWIINFISTRSTIPTTWTPKTCLQMGCYNLQPLFKWPCTWGKYIYISTLSYIFNKWMHLWKLRWHWNIFPMGNPSSNGGMSLLGFRGVSAMNQSLWIRQKKNTLDSFWAEFSFVNVNVLRNELGGATKDDSPTSSLYTSLWHLFKLFVFRCLLSMCLIATIPDAQCMVYIYLRLL